VVYFTAFFRGGNNDPASAFVLESMGARELNPIPGTSLYIYAVAGLLDFVLRKLPGLEQHSCCCWMQLIMGSSQKD